VTEREEEYRKYFEVLELSPGASRSELRAAYQHLRELYSSESIALSPLDHELSDEWKQDVLERVEEAYAKLTALVESGTCMFESSPRPGGNGRLNAVLETVDSFSGDALRQIRKTLGIEIHELAHRTKIGKQHLTNIEEENFSALPEKVFLRGYLASFAKHLALDREKVVSDYLARYEAWEREGRSDSPA
jgi:flagellar biosynthesis protein FlhG